MAKIVFIFVMFSSLILSAQEHSYGVKVGGNFSEMVGDGTQDLSLALRPHFGFYMEILIDDFGYFQPELLYTSYGYELENQGSEGNPNIGLNYLALSVLSKFVVFKNLSLDAGPQVGLLLSVNDREDVLSDVKSDFYNRDFGINLGVSYKFLKKMAASFRYYIGLTDITVVNTKNYNRSFQLAIQYKLI